MEEDILKYTATVMFRGTPCTYSTHLRYGKLYTHDAPWDLFSGNCGKSRRHFYNL